MKLTELYTLENKKGNINKCNYIVNCAQLVWHFYGLQRILFDMGYSVVFGFFL